MTFDASHAVACECGSIRGVIDRWEAAGGSGDCLKDIVVPGRNGNRKLGASKSRAIFDLLFGDGSEGLGDLHKKN